MSVCKIGPYKISRIYTGDARTLGELVPDGSADLIFTDPPYHRSALALYKWLAEWSIRVLRAGGFLLVMGGGLFVDEIMRMLSAHLRFYFIYHVYLSGNKTSKVFPNGDGICRQCRAIIVRIGHLRK